jgi:hypothetical protein
MHVVEKKYIYNQKLFILFKNNRAWKNLLNFLLKQPESKISAQIIYSQIYNQLKSLVYLTMIVY